MWGLLAPLLKGLEVAGKATAHGAQAAGKGIGGGVQAAGRGIGSGLHTISRGAGQFGRKIGAGLNELGQMEDGDDSGVMTTPPYVSENSGARSLLANPAKLDEVRRKIATGPGGQSNPAIRSRPVMSQLETPVVNDRPPAVINARPRYEPQGPGDLPAGRTVQVPLLRGPGEAAQASEPPRTMGDPAFRAATREPEVAGLDFSISPNRSTVAVPEMRANGKTKMSRPDNTAFSPVDYADDPIGQARRDAQVQANFDPELQSFGGRLKRGLKTGGVAALNAMAQRYQANPRADVGELLGAGVGAFGAGTALTTANPMEGAGLQFDATRRPKMEAEIYGRQKREDRKATIIKRGLDEAYRQAQTDKLKQPPAPKAPPRSPAPKREWMTGPDGNPTLVDTNAPDFDPSKYQPYNKPGAPVRPGAVSDNAPYLYDSQKNTWIPNPGYQAKAEKTGGVTPAEQRQRTNAIAGELSKHNKLRSDVTYLGAQIQRMKPTDKGYADAVDQFNAAKKQFDDESERLRSTYSDEIEDHGQGGWAFFKPKTRSAAKPSAQPAAKTMTQAELQRAAAHLKKPLAEVQREYQRRGYTIR